MPSSQSKSLAMRSHMQETLLSGHLHVPEGKSRAYEFSQYYILKMEHDKFCKSIVHNNRYMMCHLPKN